VEGERRAEARDKRGRDVNGRREKRGRKAGFSNWRGVGEIWKITQHCAMFRNRKAQKGPEPTKIRCKPWD